MPTTVSALKRKARALPSDFFQHVKFNFTGYLAQNLNKIGDQYSYKTVRNTLPSGTVTTQFEPIPPKYIIGFTTKNKKHYLTFCDTQSDNTIFHPILDFNGRLIELSEAYYDPSKKTGNQFYNRIGRTEGEVKQRSAPGKINTSPNYPQDYVDPITYSEILDENEDESYILVDNKWYSYTNLLKWININPTIPHSHRKLEIEDIIHLIYSKRFLVSDLKEIKKRQFPSRSSAKRKGASAPAVIKLDPNPIPPPRPRPRPSRKL